MPRLRSTRLGAISPSRVLLPSFMEFNFLSGVLDPRITYTRSGIATRYNASGLLETVADNVARLDYGPGSTTPRGLLIEPARKNLLLQSNNFGTPWGITNGSFVAANVSAPDGSLTASRFRPTGDAAFGQNFIPPATVTHTLSIWARCTSGTRSVRVYFYRGTPFTVISSPLVTLTTTWQRFSISAAALDSTLHTFQFGGGGSMTAGSDIDVWYAQAEVGAANTAAEYPTSIIPTTTAIATREADIAQVQGEMFASVYNNSANTTVFEFLTDNTENAFRAIGGVDANTANRIGGFLNFSPQQVASRMVAGGVATNPSNTGTWATGAVGKVAFAFGLGVNQAATSFNGGAPALTSHATAPVGINAMKFGNLSGMVALGGYVRRAAYYPRRLTDAELQAITT